MKIQLKLLIKPLDKNNTKSVWVKPNKLCDRRVLKESFGQEFVKISTDKKTNVFLPVIEAIYKIYSYFLNKEESKMIKEDYLEISEALIEHSVIDKWFNSKNKETKAMATLIKLEVYKEKEKILQEKGLI